MDFESLLVPFSSEQPCGVDLSFSAQVDAIREMRREDDPTLEQGEWVTPLKLADWAGVARACETLLRDTSKDLAVTSWLTDAWARLRGLAGLADGLNLTAALIERHWPALHPQPDGDGQEQRIGCLVWLAMQVESLSRRMPLVEGSGCCCSLADVEVARHRRLHPDALPDDATALPGEPPLALDAVVRAVAALGCQGFTLRRQQIAAAQQGLLRLQGAVEARLPSEGPSFAAARAALERLEDAWVRLGREAGVGETPPTAPAAAVTRAVVTTPGQPAEEAATEGPIRSRAQALQQLRWVAEYFRSAEPHSPVGYLADKAARWGDMPLHEWLRAVVKDGAQLLSFEELLGVPPRDAGG